MTEEQLKNLLFKMSVIAVHSISDGSEDPISVQEAIETNSYSRPIIFSTQIMSVNNIGDSEKEITFALSPDYLIENHSLVLQGRLDELSWTYKLPQYDYGNEEVLMEDADGQISMRSEEGVVNWLIRGAIELVKVNARTYELDLEAIYQSVMNTNSD
jgi:hypothetical protein